MEDGDALFFFNFRPDRARQLTAAFTDTTPNFTGFERASQPQLSHFISMTEYTKSKFVTPAFPPHVINNTFGEIIAAKGLRQLRIAETEKYAHVTYFFKGGKEQVFPNEERILIPSPSVATYDLQPEMNAPLLTKTLVDEINQNKYDVIICNYANADMVGHTGNLDAALRAIACLDTCIGQVADIVEQKGGQLFITSDHGNAETMYDEKNGQAFTAHTNNPVPLLYIGKESLDFKSDGGSLMDIAPTLLARLNIEKPDDMTGHSLLIAKHES
jgi:2,3-bisphosphoglycerate-independent phosphoglycerate mutase